MGLARMTCRFLVWKRDRVEMKNESWFVKENSLVLIIRGFNNQVEISTWQLHVWGWSVREV